MYKDVQKNKYGYYELKKKPTKNELKRYYSEKYYQENKSNYKKEYSEDELRNIQNKLLRRYDLIKSNHFSSYSFLDIGCGEGWSLNFFHERGWTVTGIDYSHKGIQTHNPHLLDIVQTGDILEVVKELIEKEATYDLVLLDNVLEHVLDPKAVLEMVSNILDKNGILMIEVPNDFSLTQQHLASQKLIHESYWIAKPDHISYFNREGLNQLCMESGFKDIDVLSDFPIDFNLFNEQTNYIEHKDVGRVVHRSRLKLENFLHDISSEDLNNLYKIFAKMGVGRNIFGVYRLAFYNRGLGE